MDAQMMSSVVQWVQSNVGNQTSKQELVDKAQGSNLPDEAKGAINEMPNGTYSKDDVIDQLKQKLTAGVGGTSGGLGGMISGSGGGGFGGGSGGGGYGGGMGGG